MSGGKRIEKLFRYLKWLEKMKYYGCIARPSANQLPKWYKTGKGREVNVY